MQRTEDAQLTAPFSLKILWTEFECLCRHHQFQNHASRPFDLMLYKSTQPELGGSVKLKVIVAMDADKQNIIDAQVRSLKPLERFINGIKATGLCWGLAVLSIFVPVLHFFLVPGFLIAGIVIFFVTYRKNELLEQATIICPSCSKEFSLFKLSFLWPLHKDCPDCQNVLLIEQN